MSTDSGAGSDDLLEDVDARRVLTWPQTPAEAWSGRRESNPHEKLGKLSGYHYITPAEAGAT